MIEWMIATKVLLCQKSHEFRAKDLGGSDMLKSEVTPLPYILIIFLWENQWWKVVWKQSQMNKFSNIK